MNYDTLQRYLMVLALGLAFGCGVVCGQSKEELQKIIEKAEKEIAQTTQILNKTKSDKQLSQNQLKLVQSRISSRRRLLTSLESQLSLTEREIRANSRRIDTLSSEIALLREDYAKMVYASYKSQKTSNLILFIFSSNDFNDATRRMYFIRQYNKLRREKATQIESMSTKLSEEMAALNAKREQLSNTKKAQQRELTSLSSDERTYKTSMASLQKRERSLSNQLKIKQKQIADAQKKIEQIIASEVKRHREANISAANQKELLKLSGKFENNKGRLPHPVLNGVVIDRFGTHAHQQRRETQVYNPGINIAAQRGEYATCVFDGVVTGVFAIPVYNTCVMVRHGSYITVYANLVSVAVKTGDKVATNQRLGRINDSDDPDANFLHFEIRKEVTCLNPEDWLRK